MELTFIGHQSWLFSHRGTHVLLDPVLDTRFGHCEHVDFRVYPPRRVDVGRMPKIDAVILSHEHLDHFHLPSLDLLPRDVPFFMGPLLPACVARAIEALGFRVHRVLTGQRFEVEALAFTLFAGARETVFWEKRVTQVHVAPVDADQPAVFVGVDALISSDYADDVARGRLPPPAAVIVANNSQQPPPGAVGSYSNLFPLDAAGREHPRFPGIALLHSLFIGYLDQLPEIPNVILCGNGFVNLGETFGPFLFSDNRRLAALANELSHGKGAFGPYPGETIRFADGEAETGRVSWIELDRPLMDELLARQARFLEDPVDTPLVPIAPQGGPRDRSADLAVIEAELERLAPALLRSAVGQLSIAVQEHLQGPSGPRRILFRFRESADDETVHQYALDLAEGRFVPDATPGDEVLEAFPFGIELYLDDYLALLAGRLQIWDLAGNAMRSWFMGSVYENIIVFLFEYYGEQCRPDLAWKVYESALQRLRRRRERAA